MVLNRRSGPSVTLDAAFLTLLSELFLGGDTELQDQYLEAVHGSSDGVEQIYSYKSISDGLVGFYVVLSCVFGSIGLLSASSLSGPLSGALVLGSCVLFGPVAAQTIGHGMLAPIFHRRHGVGKPWGATWAESTVFFSILSAGFGLSLWVLLRS